MAEIHRQLALFGSDELKRQAELIPDMRRRMRELNLIEAASSVLGEISPEDLAFQHSGLCQTFLPHVRPASNDLIWQRSAGRFHLMVSPGVIRDASGQAKRVGVPFGPRARLIMIFLQSEGVKSRTVSMGKTMSAWIRSLNLPVTGGPRGTMQSVQDQALRIARCEFTMQWDAATKDGVQQTIIKDQRLVSGMMWQGSDNDHAGSWSSEVELSREFHEALREHAVPLPKDAIAFLQNNSLGLDLYALFAYRLPRLQRPLLLTWKMLATQTGSEAVRPSHLSQRCKKELPDVLAVYPHADVRHHRNGLMLHPSRPPVPKTMVNGFRLIADA